MDPRPIQIHHHGNAGLLADPIVGTRRAPTLTLPEREWLGEYDDLSELMGATAAMPDGSHPIGTDGAIMEPRPSGPQWAEREQSERTWRRTTLAATPDTDSGAAGERPLLVRTVFVGRLVASVPTLVASTSPVGTVACTCQHRDDDGIGQCTDRVTVTDTRHAPNPDARAWTHAILPVRPTTADDAHTMAPVVSIRRDGTATRRDGAYTTAVQPAYRRVSVRTAQRERASNGDARPVGRPRVKCDDECGTRHTARCNARDRKRRQRARDQRDTLARAAREHDARLANARGSNGANVTLAVSAESGSGLGRKDH